MKYKLTLNIDCDCVYLNNRDDELTEYPETEYEDPSFNSVNNGGGGGLFSGKGAAKGTLFVTGAPGQSIL